MERDFKGIWIPKEIWLSETLTLQEKVFLVEISSLDNESGCYANNEYFSKFFGISKTRVSEVINSLINKGVLFCHIDKANGNKRILTTIKEKINTLLKKSLIPSSTFLEDPIKEKFKHNNTDNNIINNTKEIKEAKPPVILSFEDFWNMYDYKVGIAKAQTAFEKLSKTDLEAIKKHLPIYVKNTEPSNAKIKKGLTFRKHPSSYLNQKTFLDEIIEVIPHFETQSKKIIPKQPIVNAGNMYFNEDGSMK